MEIIASRKSKSFFVILAIAGLYHIVWGTTVVFFPGFWFRLAGMHIPNYPELWQYIGMEEAVFGLGYLFASSNPVGHWRIVLLGFATKIFAALGFAFYFFQGREPEAAFNMILMNDLLWLVPFALILYNAYKHPYLLDNEMMRLNSMSLDELSQLSLSNRGNTLYELMQDKPVLLVFLRQFGCIFCKDTLDNIRQLRPQIEARGTRIVLVNMLDDEQGLLELKKYGLDDLDYISDPECMLYKGFKLRRGTLSQLLGVRTWLRMLQLLFARRIFNSASGDMDVFQMPGIFLLYKGRVKKHYIHETAADIPPYLELASCEQCNH